MTQSRAAKDAQNAKLIISLCQLGGNIIILVEACVFIKKPFEKTKQNIHKKNSPLHDLFLFWSWAKTTKSSNAQVQFLTPTVWTQGSWMASASYSAIIKEQEGKTWKQAVKSVLEWIDKWKIVTASQGTMWPESDIFKLSFFPGGNWYSTDLPHFVFFYTIREKSRNGK